MHVFELLLMPELLNIKKWMKPVFEPLLMPELMNIEKWMN